MPDHTKPVYCEITVAGHLDSHWSEWFDGLSISHQKNMTVLDGAVADQAALHGLLTKVRDLGLPLLAVHCIEPSLKTTIKE
jgi:hypothetical protein